MLNVAALAVQCGVLVDQGIMVAIVRIESGGNPYALSVNGDVELVREPRNREEAVTMAVLATRPITAAGRGLKRRDGSRDGAHRARGRRRPWYQDGGALGWPGRRTRPAGAGRSLGEGARC